MGCASLGQEAHPKPAWLRSGWPDSLRGQPLPFRTPRQVINSQNYSAPLRFIRLSTTRVASEQNSTVLEKNNARGIPGGPRKASGG